MYSLKFSKEAVYELERLKKQVQIKKLKKIKLALNKLQENPRYPGLHTHKNNLLKGHNGEDVFQSYVENRTPGAFRVFWFYGPDKDEITILAITPHP